MSARPLFALVDGNNFFVSCERVFNPRLQQRPLVVLSNNDGCAVARSNEVKALGVKMGTPWFQMKDLSRRHGITALSSNFVLYGDMSDRVVAILRDFSPDVEVYSIDESFVRMDGVARLLGIAIGSRAGDAAAYFAMDGFAGVCGHGELPRRWPNWPITLPKLAPGI